MPLPCRPADFHKRKHDGLQLLARGSAAGLFQLCLLHSEMVLVLVSESTCIHAMMADCVIRHNYRPKNCIPLISSIARGNSKREGNQHQHRKCKDNHSFSFAKHRTLADFDSAPPRWKFLTFLWTPCPPRILAPSFSRGPADRSGIRK